MRTATGSVVGALWSHAARDPGATALRFLATGDADGPVETLTTAGLAGRVAALAAALAGERGARALLLFPPGLDFVVAFFGCLTAGVVAVPAYPPDPVRLARTLPRLRSIVVDAGPTVVLTTSPLRGLADGLLDHVPELRGVRWVAVDEPLAEAEPPAVAPPADVPAFLQYTSGSTGTPKGVVVTHGNLFHNAVAGARMARHGADASMVSWLPCFHDMGLIGGVVQPVFVGFPSTLMSPGAFLQRPVRWLEALTRFRGTTTAFPNFALDLCVRKVTDEELARLDLSALRFAANGSEPVRSGSLERFAARFAPAGLRPSALRPVYGLAESTLLVTGERATDRWSTVRVEGRTLVACGRPVADTEVVVVDPATGRRRRTGEVGEIWVRGPSVAAGYWGRPDETASTFGATLSDGDGPFLRTGDQGALDASGELCISGRTKDLIVVRGVNHWPQDLEVEIEAAHAAIRPGGTAAVAIERGDEEQLAVLAEVAADLPEAALAPVADAVRRRVADASGVAPSAVVLLAPGSLPKTTSGKIQRHAARLLVEAGAARLRWWAPAPPAAPEDLLEVLERVTGLPRAALTAERRLSELGLDSVVLATLLAELGVPAGVPGDPTLGELASVRAGVPGRAPRIAQSRLEDFDEVRALRETLAALGPHDPYFPVLDGPAGPTVSIRGRSYVNFATFDYLGLAADPRVADAAVAAIRRFGTSTSASRVVSGERPVHRALEAELAAFLGTADAVALPSGHGTNTTVIPALVGEPDVVVLDSLAHDSLVAGARQSGARRLVFAHNDPDALDRVLRAARPAARRVLVAVEGAYSMDGDLAPLRALVAVKRRHGALLLVDEAHSLGCVGATGRGIAEHEGVDRSDVDVWMGSLAKALGSCGGFLAGTAALVEYLRYRGGGFVFAAGLPPASAAAAHAALRILRAEPERVAALQRNTAAFLTLVRARGADPGRSAGAPIVPVMAGSSAEALRLAAGLGDRGIHVHPIVHPAVEDGRARLRFFLSALHRPEHLNAAAAALGELARRPGDERPAIR